MNYTIEYKKSQAMVVANHLFKKHGLNKFKFKINKSRSTIGITNHFFKKIEVSEYFIKMATVEQFIGVMMHEISHALVGPGHGHDDLFFETYTNLTNDTKYSGEYAYDILINRYKYTCDECASRYNSYRKEICYCRNCAEKGIISELHPQKNEIELTKWD